MQADRSAFLELVVALRALGAVRVRDGALEASFAGAPVADEPAPSKPARRGALSKSEREELDELRAAMGRAEELG